MQMYIGIARDLIGSIRQGNGSSCAMIVLDTVNVDLGVGRALATPVLVGALLLFRENRHAGGRCQARSIRATAALSPRVKQ